MDLLKAASVEQALDFLEAHPGARILAGGTDLVIELRKKKAHPAALLDISSVEELKTVTEENGRWRLGAALTYGELLEAALPEGLSGLKQAARQVGSPQIRNTATIGGNVCNSSPAADIVPPFLALDARLRLASRQSGQTVERVVPLSGFFTGKGHNCLLPGELLREIEFGPVAPGAELVFEKLGLREALAISRICLAVYAEPAGDGLGKVRIASGSLGETGQREPETEDVLTNQLLDDEHIARAQTVLSEACARRLAGRSTLPFKREAVMGLLGHALRTLNSRRDNQ